MDYQYVKVRRDGPVTTVVMNRPEHLNALSLAMTDEMESALREAARDEEVRVVVLTGEGRGFCTGGDVKEMHTSEDPVAYLRDQSRGIHRCVLELRGMAKPTVAGINGHAVGAGLALALACDLSVAGDKVKLKPGFTNVGLAPGCGTYFFPKLMGYARACRFVFMDEALEAKEAGAMGVVNWVVPPDEYEAKLGEVVAHLAAGPTAALAKAKELLNRSYLSPLAAQMEQESICVSRSGLTDDFKEGAKAFNEGREPKFRGR